MTDPHPDLNSVLIKHAELLHSVGNSPNWNRCFPVRLSKGKKKKKEKKNHFHEEVKFLYEMKRKLMLCKQKLMYYRRTINLHNEK